MWANYGGSNSGFAIELDLSRPPFIQGNHFGASYSPCFVDYSAERPAIEMARISGQDRKLLYTKAQAWDYESEIRAICNFEQEQIGPDGVIQVDPLIFKSVTFGTRCDLECRDLILRLRDNPVFAHLKFFDLKENSDGYGFCLSPEI